MDMDITLARIAVAMVAKESTIGCIDADGVEQWQQGVRPGRVALKQFVQFMGPNDQLKFGDGVTPLVPAGRAVPQQHRPQDFESGANPDFKPTIATTLQRRMALQMRRLQQTSDAVERRIAGLDSVRQKQAAAEDLRARIREKYPELTVDQVEQVAKDVGPRGEAEAIGSIAERIIEENKEPDQPDKGKKKNGKQS